MTSRNGCRSFGSPRAPQVTAARPPPPQVAAARRPGQRSPLQPGEPGLFLSGELLPCSGECRGCRTLPAVELPSGSGEEHGEGPQATGGGGGGGGGGGSWCGRGGLPRAPPPPRVGLPPPPGVCAAVAGPARPPVGVARVGLMLREAAAARARPPPGALAPLLVGLPCCCCCLSWKGTVARMGWRRPLAPAPPPAAAAPPPPGEAAGVGEPPRRTRWWDIVRWGRRREAERRARSAGGSRRGSRRLGQLPRRSPLTPGPELRTLPAAPPCASSTIVPRPPAPPRPPREPSHWPRRRSARAVTARPLAAGRAAERPGLRGEREGAALKATRGPAPPRHVPRGCGCGRSPRAGRRGRRGTSGPRGESCHGAGGARPGGRLHGGARLPARRREGRGLSSGLSNRLATGLALLMCG